MLKSALHLAPEYLQPRESRRAGHNLHSLPEGFIKHQLHAQDCAVCFEEK